MIRATLLALVAALPLAAQSSTPDPSKLERIRKMSPEERKKLLERLDKYKKLSEDERERLRQNLTKFRDLPPEVQKNLKEKARNLTDLEKKELQDVAASFFKSMSRKINKRELQSFPRMAFFVWLKKNRTEEFERIRALPADERIQPLLKFVREFRAATETQMAKHVQNCRVKCISAQDLEGLSKAPEGEFWTRWREVMKQQSAHSKKPDQMRRTK